MSSVRSLFEAFIIMIVCIIIATVLLFAVGIPMDNIFTAFTNANFEDVGSQWDTFEDRDFIITAFYVLDYGIVLIGILNFLATAVRRQEYDDYYIPSR